MIGLCDPFLIGLSQIERYGNWFCNLGRDSPVLGHGSRGDIAEGDVGWFVVGFGHGIRH